MKPFTFLAALPAVLGFGGFVLYELLGTHRAGDEITRRIIEKLRQQAPNSIEKDQRLTSSQVERLLVGDQNLQELIGKQDFLLLQQALRQQFITSLTVYSLAVVFCGLSVGLFVRHAEAKKQLQIDHWSVASMDPASDGLPVDLDPLQISWQSTGEPEDVSVYLENVQTSGRTDAMIAPSSTNTVRFVPDSYHKILQNRQLGQTNRIRAVMQAREAVFASNPIELPVGITILTVVDAEARLTVAAMIDHGRIQNYDFEAKIVIPSRSLARASVSIGPSIPFRFPVRRVNHPNQIDWDSAKGIYIKPDDPRLVRFEFLVDSSLKR